MKDEFEARLSLELADEADQVEAEDESRRLRRELLDTPVSQVDFALDDKPSSPRAKGVDPVTWGTLLVTLSAKGGVLQAVVSAVQTFLGRGRVRSVKIQIGNDKLEIAAASPQDQERLIEAFLKRHSDTAE